MSSVAATLFKIAVLHYHLREIIFTDVAHALSCTSTPEVQRMSCSVYDPLGCRPSRHFWGPKDDDKCFGDGRYGLFMSWSSSCDACSTGEQDLDSTFSHIRRLTDLWKTGLRSPLHLPSFSLHAAVTKRLHAGWSSHWTIANQRLR